MSQVLLICFREGLESFLVIALAAIVLRQTGQGRLLGALRWGLAFSVAGSALLGLVLARIGALSPLWEGGLALLAAVAVVTCVFHLFKAGPQAASEIRRRLETALHRQPRQAWWAVFGLTVFMVGREGVEAATMIASMASQSDARGLMIGGTLGLGLAGLVALMWARYGRRVDVGRFLKVSAWFMLAFALQLVFYAAHEFSEVGVIPLVDNAAWHIATEEVAEGWISQALAIVMVAVPTLWLAVAAWRDRRLGLQGQPRSG